MSHKQGGILLGPGCSNRCPFCISGNGEKQTKKELRKQEVGAWKDLLSYKKKGYKDIEISGSDPLEYEKIVPFVKYIKKCGFKNILLNTHGKNLCDKKFANKLIESGINGFRIPLYSTKASVYDSITKVEGSFAQTIEGLKNIYLHPIRLVLHTLILKENKECLLDTLKMAIKFKADEFGIAVLYIPEGDYSMYVPYKDLYSYVKDLDKFINDKKVKIVDYHDIPHCVFGKFNQNVVKSYTPDMGKFNQHSKKVRSKVKNLPKYRLKTYLDMCKKCVLFENCDGFLIKDVEKYGTGNLKPILDNEKEI